MECFKSFSKVHNMQSFLIALSLLFDSICLLVNCVFPNISRFGAVLVIIIVFLGGMSCFRNGFHLNIRVVVFSLVVFLWILISFVCYSFSNAILTLLLNYTVWGICIVCIMMQGFDIEKTISISFYISLVIVICVFLTQPETRYDSMVLSYAIFPCIAVFIVHYYYYRYHDWKKQLLYIPCVVAIVKFLFLANRGALLSLFFVIILLLMRSKCNKKEGLIRNDLLTLLVLGVIVLVALVFDDIVLVLYDVAANCGIRINALEKIHVLMSYGNLDNNRNELYKQAWEGFLYSPFCGNGVGSYTIKYGTWVHNLFLQLLYEGGLILTFIVSMPLVHTIWYFITSPVIFKRYYSLFVLLFCTAIPRLMFSTELWKTPSFWMLLAFGILIQRKDTNEKLKRG